MTEEVIEYNVTEARIAELTKQKDDLLGASEPDYVAIEIGIKVNGKLRIGVEKRRKFLKSDALAYGRKIDDRAKEVSAPLIANEEALKAVFNAHQAELEAVRVEHNRKENIRIAAIEERIEGFLFFKDKVVYNTTAGEIKSIIAEFDEALAEEFDYSEFKDKAFIATQETMEFLRAKFYERTAVEAEQAEQAAQRKKDETARAELEAEKAAFAAQQKEAQDKIDAERAAIEAEKKAILETRHKEEKIALEKEHEAKMQKAKEELARQRAIDEEAAAVAKETERLRLEQVAKEEAERKASQAAEDRVRNAAPELLEALELLYFQSYDLDADFDEEISQGNEITVDYKKAQEAIKLAKGE